MLLSVEQVCFYLFILIIDILKDKIVLHYSFNFHFLMISSVKYFSNIDHFYVSF